jgi:mono/diheme cytochrome c family protein
MKYKITALIILAILLSFTASAADRWYDDKIVASRSQLFQHNCAVCHGANAQGTREWKKTDFSGRYPPPPLNGSAHAWHHSIPQLARSIKQDGRRKSIRPGTIGTCSNFQLCYHHGSQL